VQAAIVYINVLLKNVICFVFLILFTQQNFAATTPSNQTFEINNNASQFLTRLSPNEGLSQSSVRKTVQDQQGFIWIATEMGLNRYDGYQVQIISGPNDIFTKESISTLFIDNQGYLWVSTLYSGLYRLNTKTFESKQFFSGKFAPNSPDIAEVITIEQARGNALWLGISGQVMHLDVDSGKLSNYLTLKSADDIVRDLLVTKNWLFCATSQGLYRINIKTKIITWLAHRPKSVNDKDSINTKFLIEDKQLGLLVGTINGLFSLENYLEEDSNKIQGKQLLTDFNIWSITPDHENYLIATNIGLYRFNPSDQQTHFVLKFSDSPFRITDNNILDIFHDRTGNFWLASRSQGVMLWSPLTSRFKNISASTPIKLSHDNIWGLFQDKQGILWIGGDNGLNRLNLKTGKINYYLKRKDIKAVYGEHVIRQIFKNSENEQLLWLVNDDGLRTFNKKTGVLSLPFYNEQSQKLMKGKWLSGLSVIDNQHILFFTDKSFYLYNSSTGNVKPLLDLNKMIPVELAWSFLGNIGDNKNDVLLAVSGKLYRYNLASEKLDLLYKSRKYQPQNYDYVDHWVLDKNNILWLAMTGEGLIGIDYKTLEEKYRFDTSNGLTTNSIYSLQTDQYNHLWFSSQLGLFRLNSRTHHLQNYTAKDGLFANEYNGSSFVTLNDGRLIFGSTRGISIISPQEFVNTGALDNDNKVSLTDFQLFSENSRDRHELSQSKEIILNYNDYGLKLHFSTLQFLQQDQTRYKIDLEGPSPLHFKEIRKNELLLSKLAPGNYHLSIVAINPITGNLSAPLTIDIRALQAPWLTFSAKLSYALILFLIVFSYIKVRTNQRKKLEVEHEKLQDSQTQIQLALDASASGIWDYDIQSDQHYESRSVKHTNNNEADIGGTSIQQHFDLIAPEHRQSIESQWHEFIRVGQHSWDVSFRMKTDNGSWQWFRETGAVIKRDENGLPVRVSGTYTNISDSKANEAQMLLYGEAFRQINDWVLILDDKKSPLTANKAFMNAFTSKLQKSVPTLKYIFNLIGEQKYQKFKEIISSIKPGSSWQGEEVIATKENEQHPVLIKINAISVDAEVITHYVAVISDISVQKNAEEKLRHLAHYDYLTNLPNRKLILEKIDHTIKEYSYSAHQSALFFIDLDKFKQVNDSLGHHTGDELLKHVADTLIANVKARDIVARQSGDEFMVLIKSVKQIDDLTHLAQRINLCLANPLKINGSQINISSSIGIALFPDDATTSSELIRKADLAMIHAKQSGRSQFQFFTQEMNAQAHRRIELEGDLIIATKNQELVNYYQPIVDCANRKVLGFELLMRWPHLNGMISPTEFIPIAEEIGVISELTEQAVDRALHDYVGLAEQFPHCYISVNLSAIHILQQGLCETLLHLLNKHNLPVSVLRLEITEGTLLVDKKTALNRLIELKAQGFKLLLDDFGTGYSSLTYLSQFPIDVLKIDQSFVRHLQTNSMNKPIIQAIVSLANSLSLSCVAEGIEDLEQLSYIRELGCDYIQGYYFSRPLAINEIIDPAFWQGINNKLSLLDSL